jgi:CRISPR-associated protein Csb1
MIEGLTDEPRLILKARLTPTAGSVFQPTGFPDLGPAEFTRPLPEGEGNQSALLVESVQSMANRLEDNGWDQVAQQPVGALSGLPYVEVRDGDGNFLTSSRLEPHRLAGAYIRGGKIEDKGGDDWLFDEVGLKKEQPLDWRALYASLFRLDPLCLLHGVFFSSKRWNEVGNPKVRRAVTAVIEAHDIQPVVSGGVKRDDVNPTKGENRGSSDGFGFIPFGRTEYTAREIELTVVVDLEQIRGYGLGEDETELLTAVALWEVRSLLDRPLRLRTACDLELAEGPEATRPEGWTLPTAADLEAVIAAATAGFDNLDPAQVEFK